MICDKPADSEEEILVFADFGDTVNMENYSSIHVLGISRQNPIIQLDDTIFTGQLESPLGTYMFFVKDATSSCVDPLFDKLPKENVKYLCKADKYLRMKHTYITPIEGAETEIYSEPLQEEDSLVPLTFNSVPEAVEAFKTVWQSKIQDTETKKILPGTTQNYQDKCDDINADEDPDMTDIDFKTDLKKKFIE